MYRFAFTVVVVVAVTASRPANAQEWTGGIKAGAIGTSIAVTGANAFDTGAEIGVEAGAFAGIALGATARLQVEALFARRRFSSRDFPLPLAVKSRSVEIPVLVVKRFKIEHHVQPLVYGGPQISVIGRTTQTLGPVVSDLSRELREADIGMTVGGGVEVAARRGAVVIECRVNSGFRDLSVAKETTMRSRAFSILAGYRF